MRHTPPTPHTRQQVTSAASRLVDDLEDLYALRLLVEAEGIRRTVPTLADREAAQLIELAEQIECHSGLCEPQSLARADRAFHLQLVTGAGLRVRTLAADLADSANEHSRIHLPNAGASDPSLREHRQILAGALEQDVERCVRRTISHHLRTVVDLAAQIDPAHPLKRVRIAALHASGDQISAFDLASR